MSNSRASNQPGIATVACGGRNEFNPTLHLPQIAAAGFTAIELTLLSGLEHFEYTNPQKVSELETIADDLGIVVWSIHEQDIQPCLGAPDLSERQAAADEVRQCLKLAQRLGAKAIPSHLLMNPAFETDESEESKIEKRIVEMLHNMAPEVRASGARIAFENTGRRTYARPAAVARRMDTLPTDAYGFVLDTGHANLMGDLDVIADLLGDRLMTLHLNDNHGLNDEHLPPGQGTVDWTSVRQLLQRVRYDGCLLNEVEGGTDPARVMLDTMAAHRRLFESD